MLERDDVSALRGVHIGTSGWSYRSWRGPFFPKALRIKDHLLYYSEQFDTAELNGVFYRTPSPETVTAWRTRTPPNFVFAWKASKFITHWKRLNVSSQSSLTLLESRLALLGNKVGPVLFQLPPQMDLNYVRLAEFISSLQRTRRYAFEFRHPSWYDVRVLSLLRDNNIALCVSDHHDAPSPAETTASFVYLRAHGPAGDYRGHYPRKTLLKWASNIRAWRKRKLAVFVYFDNDQKSAAPADALQLKKLLARA